MAGDLVQESDGTWQAVLSSSREEFADGITVYNFEVEGDHTYFVADGVGAEDAVWVHNDCNIPSHTAPGMGNVTHLNGMSKRLYGQGYVYQKPANDGVGRIYKNAVTGEEVRIHRNPGPSSTDPGKISGNWYYRYRTNFDKRWSVAVPLQ